MHKKWSLYLGSPWGIKIFVHWTFLILIAWIFIMHFRAGNGIREGLSGVLFILALFTCVVMHEFGHALTARRFKVYTRDITLYPIGGIASLESMPSKPIEEFQVAVAGPTVNLVIAALLWIYFKSTGHVLSFENTQNIHMTGAAFGLNLIYVNIILAVFNLIPAFPMDGGRVLRSLLSMKINASKATSVAVTIGQIIAIAFVFLGFFYDFWLIFIGLFIFLGAGAESKTEELKHAIEGVKAENIMMTNFMTINSDVTLETAAEKLLGSNEKSLLVMENGTLLGILDYKNIVEGLHKGQQHQRVADFTTKDIYQFDIDEYISDKLLQILQGGQSLFPVIKGGKVVGVISSGNLYRWLQSRPLFHKAEV